MVVVPVPPDRIAVDIARWPRETRRNLLLLARAPRRGAGPPQQTEPLRVPRTETSSTSRRSREIKPSTRINVAPDGESCGLHHENEADLVRQRRLRRDVPLRPGDTRDQVRLLHPERRAAHRRRPGKPQRAVHDRRRPGVLLDRRTRCPGGRQRDHRRLRVRRRPAAADQHRHRRRRAATNSSRSGLAGVSADGIDVFFSTYETLVGQDENGAQLKFYDARTNGGFPFDKPPAPCEAADECHGADSSAPAPLQLGTTARLGSGGNLKAPAKKKKCKKGQKRKGNKCVKSEALGTRGEVGSVAERETNREMTMNVARLFVALVVAAGVALLRPLERGRRFGRRQIRDLRIPTATHRHPGRRPPGHHHRVRTRQPADAAAEPVLLQRPERRHGPLPGRGDRQPACRRGVQDRPPGAVQLPGRLPGRGRRPAALRLRRLPPSTGRLRRKARPDCSRSPSRWASRCRNTGLQRTDRRATTGST